MVLKYVFIIFLSIIFTSTTLNAYESEDKLTVIIIGKIAKFIKWKGEGSDKFTITVLKNSYGNLFDKTFSGKKIKKKNIEIKYIDNIDELTATDILYIPDSKAKSLSTILNKVKHKNILTVSSIRGFAEKGGVIQVYFISRKIKIKINLDVANEESLKISSSLLRIAKIVKG